MTLHKNGILNHLANLKPFGISQTSRIVSLSLKNARFFQNLFHFSFSFLDVFLGTSFGVASLPICLGGGIPEFLDFFQVTELVFIVGAKLQLKMTTLTFSTKLAQQDYFQSIKKNDHYHGILHIQIILVTKFQL